MVPIVVLAELPNLIHHVRFFINTKTVLIFSIKESKRIKFSSQAVRKSTPFRALRVPLLGQWRPPREDEKPGHWSVSSDTLSW